jgi:DNA-binding MarR family transcriptional regulator
MKEADGDWVSMSEAAKIVGVSTAKISRLAAKGKIQTRLNLKDERVKLVSITELKSYFSGEARKWED